MLPLPFNCDKLTTCFRFVVASVFLLSCILGSSLLSQDAPQQSKQEVGKPARGRPVEDRRLENAIVKSVTDKEWDKALSQIAKQHDSILEVFNKLKATRGNHGANLKLAVSRVTPLLERQRIFLGELSRSVESSAPEKFLTELLNSRIAVDFRLIVIHDSIIADQIWSAVDWSDYSYRTDDIKWFWQGVKATKDYYDHLHKYDWRGQAGIPLDSRGLPYFPDTPESYSETLGCGEKILFLVAEIERLDSTKEKHNAGRAMLYRARLASRLFGPSRDPEWEVSNYDLFQRPTFLPDPSVKGLKPANQLSDSETRVQVGRDVRVLSLPEQHCPLTLYRQLVQRYPMCDSVPRAMFEIGQFYQMRRQFTAAAREYERVIVDFPKHQRSNLARQQIENIKRPDVLLGRTGVYPVGSQPQVWINYRNTSAIDFTLREVKIDQFLADQSDSKGSRWRRTPSLNAFDSWGYVDKELLASVGRVVATWRAEVPEANMEADTTSTLIPHKEFGAFLLEARIPGTDETSLAIISITSAAIIYDSQSKQSSLKVVDAQTGKPLPNEKVQVIQFDTGAKKLGYTDYESNDAGEVAAKFNEESDALIYAETKNHGKAFLNLFNLQDWSDSEDTIVASYTATDRPAYRPGETVKFRSWYRQQHLDEPLACPEVGTALKVIILGPERSILKSLKLNSDSTGSVEGSVDLGREAPLGEYEIFVRLADIAQTDTDEYWMNWLTPSARFRVEEYKRPEYRVSVTPIATPHHDSKIAFELKAAYYFGDPVASAEVDYTLYRRTKEVDFVAPQPYDWLYGAGYGRYNYLYPWLGDTAPEPRDPDQDFRWSTVDPRGDMLQIGTAKLDANGRVVLQFDTAQLSQSNTTSQYTLEVDVRDDSRRAVSAQASTIITHQKVFAYAELDRGWYKPGNPVRLKIVTLDSNSRPIAASTSVELSSVGPLSASDAASSLKLLDTQPAITKEDGSTTLTFENLPVGQYRAAVKSSSGPAESLASVNFVVFGESINDERRRYGHLELIPDAPTYQPGDTAQVLVNTNHPPLLLLLEDHHGERRTIELKKQSSVIEIPITKKSSPSALYRATTVRDGQFLSESVALFVPPIDRMLQVKIETDAETYQPGSEATVRVAVTDPQGEPVTGDVVLAAYDDSVSAIAPESGIGPKQMLMATMPSIASWQQHGIQSSLGDRQFDSSGEFFCPEYSLASEMFYGLWSAESSSGKENDPKEVTKRRFIALGGVPPERGDFAPTQGGGAAKQVQANEQPIPGNDPNAAQRQFVQPVTRTNYSATAAWLPHLRLDERGQGQAKFPLPDSLTSWKLRAYSVTSKTQVGDGSDMVLTSKPLLVRLQTPRFLIDQDQVTVSAIVHNGLKSEKSVQVELAVPENLLTPKDVAVSKRTGDGQVVLVREGSIGAGESQRFDWKLGAIKPGTAKLIVKALTDEASDAMASELPIVPFTRFESKSQSFALGPNDADEIEVQLDVPDNLLAGSLIAKMDVTGSSANVLFEAIPFLIDYPHGCVEQTMSRFYPLTIAIDSLRRLNIQPDELSRLIQSSPQKTQRRQANGWALLDSGKMNQIAEEGLQRLYRFQHQDGSWGWWENDPASPYMTAYVLIGLNSAQRSGVEVRRETIEDGRRYLAGWLKGGGQGVVKEQLTPTLAFAVYALSLPIVENSAKRSNEKPNEDADDGDASDEEEEKEEERNSIRRELNKALDKLTNRKSELNHYARCLLILSLQNLGKSQEAKQELQQLLEHVKGDEESVSLPSDVVWWRWWNSDVEINALLLRSILAIDPDNPIVEKVLQGLISKRTEHGHWRSTRDTAMAVTSLSEYLVQKGKVNNKIEFNYAIDNLPTVRVNSPDLPFHPDSHLQFDADQLPTGRHLLKVSKPKGSELHLNLNVEYQQTVDTIAAVDQGISIERSYRKVKKDGVALTGTEANAPRDSFEVGDVIEVELKIRTKQSYEYFAFEDPKPAGCETLQLLSGQTWDNGLWGNIELRDRKVIFYASSLSAGEHVLKYKLRAETPGVYRAMPTTGFAMYTPEIRGNTTEQRIEIRDK